MKTINHRTPVITLPTMVLQALLRQGPVFCMKGCTQFIYNAAAHEQAAAGSKKSSSVHRGDLRTRVTRFTALARSRARGVSEPCLAVRVHPSAQPCLARCLPGGGGALLGGAHSKHTRGRCHRPITVLFPAGWGLSFRIFFNIVFPPTSICRACRTC